jgi:hypothetical protein
MITTESHKLWISGSTAAAAVALCWAFTFAARLSVLALLLLVPYIMPMFQSLDGLTRLAVFIVAPVIQFSLYGFILGRAWLRGRLRPAAILLAALHIVAIIVCYLIIASYDYYPP